MIIQPNKNKNINPSEHPHNYTHQQTNSTRKCKKYFMIDQNTKVYFNADFDSGNLQKVQQISPYIYKLLPGFDKPLDGTNKTYFHFKVYGFKMCTVRFQISRVYILQKLLKMEQEMQYKPVVKKGKGKYQPLEKGVKIYYNKADQAQLSIQYEFQQEDMWVYFSFSYPYSYQDTVNLVKQLKIKYIDHSDIYFHEEVMGYSQQGRKLYIINITQKINCSKQRQDNVEGIFPERQLKYGANVPILPGFKIKKPKVIISGRVHPGQTPASYCIEGLLRFLLDQKDYRAYLLRKHFHFIILPMLNPDGVYNGMFRLDLNGENLNRIYLNCTKQKHPTIWYFRQYLKFLQQKQETVLFYFDFHAHPSKKQFFIYGNAFNQFTHQVEAQTFGRLLENNCPYFHNIDSIFAEKQMNSKDKYDAYSKQGCGRVYVHRLFNIIHSYTVQCGYFAPGKLQKWQSIQTIKARSQVLTSEYSYVGTWQQCSISSYTPESYMLMGKNLFHLNPYTRINISELRSIATIRKNVGIKTYNNVERFRMIDANATKKIKILTQILQEEYYKVKVGRFGLSISENYGMHHPKKTFSLLSRVYLSQKDIKAKLNNLDPLTYTQINQVQQNQLQFPNQIQNQNDQIKTNLYLNIVPENFTQNKNNTTQHKIFTHSSNYKQYKQYKSQLQLKIPGLSKLTENDKDIQKTQLNQIFQGCLHADSKIIIRKPIQPNKGEFKMHNQNNNNKIDSFRQRFNKDKKQKNQIDNKRVDSVQGHTGNRKVLKQKQKFEPILSSRRGQSEKNLHAIKFQPRQKHTARQQKNITNQQSLTLPLKSQASQLIQSQQKLSIAEKIRSTRIDTFLRKQSKVSQMQDRISNLQKYITAKLNDKTARNLQNNLQKLPNINPKFIEVNKKFKNNKK